MAVGGALATPAGAFAQADTWRVDVAPLYLWAATTDGNLALSGTSDIPVYMDFADAASKLAAAFSFHGEARKGRWGFIGDINFIGLSTDVNYTTPTINAPIAGSLEFDQIIFNGKLAFAVKPGSAFRIVGGVRTLTMSPAAQVAGPAGAELVDADVSTTDVAGVAGFTYRPRLGNRVVLATQADVGSGSAFTWSAAAAIEFRITPWIGLAAGYNALHMDTGEVPKSGSAPINDLQYSMTQYGPVFSLTFHWQQK